MNKAHRIIDALLTVLFLAVLIGFGIWVNVKTPSALSLSERRELYGKPDFSFETVSDGTYFKGYEKYLLDQFPLRESFRRIKAESQYRVMMRTENNGIVFACGHAASTDTPTEKDAGIFVRRLSEIKEKYLTDNNRVYTTLIPDKLYFMKDMLGVPTVDYSMLEDMLDNDAPGEYISIFDELSLDCYYKTDSHIKQTDMLSAADKLLAGMGRKTNGVTSNGDALSPFYGVYYGQSALPLSPDEIVCVHSDMIDSASVKRADFSSKNMTDAKMYYTENIMANDPYDVFLGGACTVITIDTNADSGKTLCLFSDSFGRSLAPLLVSGYSRIVIYDIRYIAPSLAFKLVPIPDGADVLFAYSIAAVDIAATLRTD